MKHEFRNPITHYRVNLPQATAWLAARAVSDDKSETYERQLTRASNDLEVLEKFTGFVADAISQRRIWQFAMLPGNKEARRFANAATRAGMAVDKPQPEPDGKSIFIRLSHKSRPCQDAITPCTLFVEELAIKNGGTYEGWEIAIKRRDAKAPLADNSLNSDFHIGIAYGSRIDFCDSLSKANI